MISGCVFTRKRLCDHLLFDKPQYTSASIKSSGNTTSFATFTTSASSAAASLWDQEDNLIISLIICSIGSSIGATLLHLWSAMVIWDRLQHICTGAENVTRLYDVCKQYSSLELGN